MKKLNKKGFTLIELLAVIAILAILMLLVAPNILSMFNSGKKQAFITQYQRVWQAAETEYVNRSLTGTPLTVYCNAGSACTDGTGNTTNYRLDITDSDISYCVSFNSTTGKISKLVLTNGEYYINGVEYNAEFGDAAGNAKTGSKTMNITTGPTCADLS